MWAIVGAAALYFWLRGHWFARVLAFVVFIPTISVCAGKPLPPAGAIGAVIFLVSVIVLAWLTSGLPIYVRRWQARVSAVAERPHRLYLEG